MTAHSPMAQSWICLGCGSPWPCESRKRQFLAQYSDAPVSLSLLLGSALIEALQDLRDFQAGELYDQFIGWVPRHDLRGPS